MSRAYDFTVAGVIYVVSIAWHRIMIELVAPNTAIFEMASTGTSAVNGAELAQTWMEIGTIWLPLIAMAGISLWIVVREYRRQALTATRPR